MTYAELKAAIIAGSSRADLTASVPFFVQLAEEMIRRELTAQVYEVTLDEDDRVEGGLYSLPSTLLSVRWIKVESGSRERALEQKGGAELGRLPANAPVQWFAVEGATVEFRGVPAADAELRLGYKGYPPPLSDDGDELAIDSALYLYGALFHLYGPSGTQDLELAQAALDTFTDAVTKFNEAGARKLGGASVRPVYHMGPVRRRGY